MHLNQKNLYKFVNLLLVFALIIALLGFIIDIRNTLKFGGIDLRNRVVGARLLTKGLDPYHFKWTPIDDQKLLDPLDWPTIPVTRTTVNPSILLFHSLFANLPYFSQRIIWFIIQWFCFLGSIFIFIKNNLHGLRTKSILISVLIFICGSLVWRIHVDVGQFYIIYVFLLALAYECFSSEIKYGNAIGGLLIGLASCFRFPIIIMVLPIIIFKKIKMLTATLLGFLFCLLLSVLFTGSQVWQNYFSAMSTNSKLNIESIDVVGVDVRNIFPKIVEGMNNLQDFNGGIPDSNSSIQFLLKDILSLQLDSKYFIISLASVLLIYSFIIYKYRNYNNNNKNKIKEIDLIFFIGTINILIVDYFIPAPRHVYNNVFYIIPLILLIKNVNPFNTQMLSCTILMYIGFLALNGMFAWLPNETQTGGFLILGSMILMSFIFIRGSIPLLPKKYNTQMPK
jgi:Glycosyltransferase family 87